MGKSQLLMLPGPTNVPSRVMRAMAKPIINHRGPEFHELYRRIEENLMFVFETKSDVFAVTSSGTGGVECAISNIFTNGEKVAVPVNGVFSERLSKAVKTFGGESIEIPIKWGRGITPEQVEDLFATEKNIKALAVVYNETSTGTTTRNIKEIGRICHDHNGLFILDAISILGGDELPVDDWNVDICIAGSQKCLMTPPGLVILSVNERAWKAVEAARRSYYFDLLQHREFLRKHETPYTPAVSLFYALDEALSMIKEEGLGARYLRHKTCATALYEGLEAVGFKTFPDKEYRSNVVIASSYPTQVEDKEFRELLRKQHDVVVAGGMDRLKGTMIRIGAMGTISRGDVVRTLDAVESVLTDLKHDFEYGAALHAANNTFAQQDLQR